MTEPRRSLLSSFTMLRHPAPSAGRSLRRTSRRQVVLSAVMVAGAMALSLSACGGAPNGSAVASLSSTTTTTAGASSTTHPKQSQSAAAVHQSALQFAKCMRAHGITDWPDPNPGGGFVFSVTGGIDPNSPQVKAAQQKCQKYVPVGHVTAGQSARSKAQLLKFAECMRTHGITGFPDPTSGPGGSWGFNFTMTALHGTSPAYQAAMQACEKIVPGAYGHPCGASGGKRRSGAETARTRRC
jgi:hypothetical protein